MGYGLTYPDAIATVEMPDEIADGEVCAYCEEPIDYCQGHGEIGDPEGHEFLKSYYRDVYGLDG